MKKAVFTLFTLATLAAHTQAQTFNEGADAGVTIATAKAVSAGTNSITGSLVNTQTDSDVDLYQINLNFTGTFSFEGLENSGGNIDMNLMLFNSLGQFLAGDDDNNSSCTPVTSLPNSLDSCLTLNLDSGTYYIAVGDNNIGAFESLADYSLGNYFLDDDSGILGTPSTETIGMVGNISGPGSFEDEGNYTVNFSRAVGVASATAIPTIPLPGLVLTMLGLVSVASRRLRAARTTPN